MAIKLTLILSGRTLQRFEFDDAFERLKVGRNADCDITIDNLGISRYHCELTRNGAVIQVRDLNSGNGTFVNGTRTDGAYNLNAGDMISVGKFSLRFEPDETNPDESEGNTTIATDGLMTLQMDAASLAKKHRQQMSRSRGYLAFKGGQSVILEKSVFMFGADPQADRRLTGWFCPRVVAVLLRDESGFRLLDVSPKGQAVTVNGVTRRECELNDNDLVVVRKEKFHFHRGLPVGRK